MNDLTDLFSFIEESAAVTSSSVDLLTQGEEPHFNSQPSDCDDFFFDIAGQSSDLVEGSPFTLEWKSDVWSEPSKSVITDAFSMRESVTALECQLEVTSCVRDLVDNVERECHRQILTEKANEKRELTVALVKTRKSTAESKRQIAIELRRLSEQMSRITDNTEQLSASERALRMELDSVRRRREVLQSERDRFVSDFRDVSQLSRAGKIGILRFLNEREFLECAKCSRAWQFSLDRPSVWCAMIKERARRELCANGLLLNAPKDEAEKLDSSTGLALNPKVKLKQVRRCVIQLTLAPTQSSGSAVKKGGHPADEIYQQCMQQLQRVIAAHQQDRDDLRERVKASNGILNFCRASMKDKMDELSALRVRKWNVSHLLQSELTEEKRRLHEEKVALEARTAELKRRVGTMQVAFRKAQAQRQERMKVKRDLTGVERGARSQPVIDAIARTKIAKKKLVKALRQIREGIAQRQAERDKFETRVQQLEQVYHRLP